jgi:uncharacterized protein YjiS (DUF1127 family)
MSCGSSTCVSAKSVALPESSDAWSIPSPLAVLRKIDRMYERWCQRQQLLELDDHMLDDIGLTREQAIEMARKPFWK